MLVSAPAEFTYTRFSQRPFSCGGSRLGRRAIVLVIDSLRAAALGSYGAAWCETPAWDRFASRSWVCDQFHAETTDLAANYHALWQSEHALQQTRHAASLPECLTTSGVGTLLLTDDPVVANHPLASQFGELHQIEVADDVVVAERVEETRLASFFAAAAERLAEPPAEDCLLWMHTRSLACCWDAPLEYRDRLADPEDPAPPDTADVPRLLLAADHDPDLVLGHTQAYAGQITALDQCLAGLLAQSELAEWAEQCLWILCGSRGFPLGEHLRLGMVDQSLFGETTHVPLMIRHPDGRGAGTRCLDLTTPGDVAATLADWWGIRLLPVPSETSATVRYDAASLLPALQTRALPPRPYLYLASPSERALRTPHWYYRQASAEQQEELYVKPDDRWEANEVSDRCPETTALFRRLADACTATLQQPAPPSWPPLPAELAAEDASDLP